jgi:hypothetical protein
MLVPSEAGGPGQKRVRRWCGGTRPATASDPPLQSSMEWRRVKPLLLADIIGRVANVSGTSA